MSRIEFWLPVVLAALTASGTAWADITASPPEPCELLAEGAPCHVAGVDPGVCRGKKKWERKCVATPDAAAVSVTLEDAIDAGQDAGEVAASSSATPTADPPVSANAPTPPAAPAPAPAAPAPLPTRSTGCAGCSAGRSESDVGLWLAALLLAIGVIARRR